MQSNSSVQGYTGETPAGTMLPGDDCHVGASFGAEALSETDLKYPTEPVTAAHFGCSTRRLADLRRAGKIPYMRTGREIRYRRADYPLIEAAMTFGSRTAARAGKRS
jgi:hypothetical protein